MYCISINYKTADVEIRKKLAFQPEEQKKFIDEMLGGISRQCVTLCTCNRTEIYFDGEKNAPEAAAALLAAHGGFSEEELAPYIMNFVEDSALSHLFGTASGLDSMVVGEDEILRQMKSAYSFAKENGAAHDDFNMIFQSAFACAKKIKTDTALSKTSVSIATLAANEAANIGGKINVLLIGATGKTGITVLKNLASHKNISVTAAVRSRGNSFENVKNAPNVKTVSYSQRYDFLDSSDCVISATSAPHYTITAERLKVCVSTEKPRLLIDLAVPPDIDPAVKKIGNVRLIGIDYFERLAERNNLLKKDSAHTAKEIIAQEIDKLKKELAFRGFLPKINALKTAAEKVGSKKILYRLKSDLNAEQFSAVLNSLEKLAESEE